MEKMVQDHEQRILALEEFQIQTNENIEKLQKSQEETRNSMLRMENVVMTSTKETRDILQPFADHYLDKVTAEGQAVKDIKIKRMDTREKVFIAVVSTIFGTGGLAGIIVGVLAFMNGGQ